MYETDDRLAGDPVWELFPCQPPRWEQGRSRNRRYERYLTWGGLIAGVWLLSSPLAVVTACLAVALGDLRKGRRLSPSISDTAGGRILARFRYAWGAWRFGAAAFALLFISAIFSGIIGPGRDSPLAILASALLWTGGWTLSAALTALGLVEAYRSGMRIWIGEGVNQARVLVLGMLMVGFTYVVLIPVLIWLSGPGDDRGGPHAPFLFFAGFWLAAPVVILLFRDWISRRILADRPCMFGPKVPAVGRWIS